MKKSLTGKLAPLQSCKARVMGVWGGPQGAGLTYGFPPRCHVLGAWVSLRFVSGQWPRRLLWSWVLAIEF